MSTPILATKLYIPPPRPKAVPRPRLIARLNDGLHRKLTLISAPAGFGKTTLASEWLAGCQLSAAWLSLDEGDNDPTRFLIYLVAALQTMAPAIGEAVLAALQSPQPPPAESLLTTLLNEIAAVPDNASTSSEQRFVLILDDYHAIDAQPVTAALAFLLEHLPPRMHLVIATREDPQLPLARLRARGQLAELRAADLRFTPSEAAEFLNEVMGLTLSPEQVSALETRTEGWIAGLHLAALALQGTHSMQGHQDVATFIQSFTGSHRFVMDYLVEEVLEQQPATVQTFLLHTSILNRLCAPLCDAVVGPDWQAANNLQSPISNLQSHPNRQSQQTLHYLEQSNLFLVPLDDERGWYRYHHLFADLLRQRLHQSHRRPQPEPSAASGVSEAAPSAVAPHVAELHVRASQWYEDNGLVLEAFHHAAAANDVDRAARLIGSDRIPQHFRGAVTTILDWLASLPKAVLDARPWLQWRYASLLLVSGQTTGVEEKLDAAEVGLRGAAPDDDKTRNLIGKIAAARSVLALTRYQVETMLAQSRRALDYLDANNQISRATAYWTMGFAHQLQRDHAAAGRAYTEAITISQACRDTFTTILATIGLGNVHEAENRLHLAADSYRRVLQLAGDQPLQIIYEAHLGLARVLYEWNDLDAAGQHGRQSLHLARQYDKVIDRFLICELFLARLKLARGDVDGAAAIVAQAAHSARQPNFVHRIPEIAAAQILVLIRQGNFRAAAELAQTHELPISQARVLLTQGDPPAALALLDPLRRQVEAKGWQDEVLKVTVLQALAHHTRGEKDQALQLIADALALAEPGGFIRLFVDEGAAMAQLLAEAAARGMMPDYTTRLLAAFEAAEPKTAVKPHLPPAQPHVEPLSPRELEVLQLVAQGHSNREIGARLFLALATVKGHNRKIFDKLQVQRRTEAVARARELGLL